jgi:hypothetical protein
MDRDTVREIPRRKDGLHVREIEGETVVLDPGRELLHSLNATAAFIFAAIDGRRSIAEIARELSESFDVDVQTAERDTREVLRQLVERSLVEE